MPTHHAGPKSACVPSFPSVDSMPLRLQFRVCSLNSQAYCKEWDMNKTGRLCRMKYRDEPSRDRCCMCGSVPKTGPSACAPPGPNLLSVAATGQVSAVGTRYDSNRESTIHTTEIQHLKRRHPCKVWGQVFCSLWTKLRVCGSTERHSQPVTAAPNPPIKRRGHGTTYREVQATASRATFSTSLYHLC